METVILAWALQLSRFIKAAASAKAMVWLDRCVARGSRVSGVCYRGSSDSLRPVEFKVKDPMTAGGECLSICGGASSRRSYQLLNHPSNYCGNWASITPSIIQGRQTEHQKAARDVTVEWRDNKGWREEGKKREGGGEKQRRSIEGTWGEKALGTVKGCIYVLVLCLYSPKSGYYSALSRKEKVTEALLLTFLRLIDCLTDCLMLWFPAENKMMFSSCLPVCLTRCFKTVQVSWEGSCSYCCRPSLFVSCDAVALMY